MDEVDFHQAMEEWIEHCRKPSIRFSSSSEPVRDCDAYRKIVSMSYNALPLIRQEYDKDSSDNFELSIIQGHGLVSIVKEIVGDDFSIPQEIRGKISTIKEYTQKWLDQNIIKYVPSP